MYGLCAHRECALGLASRWKPRLHSRSLRSNHFRIASRSSIWLIHWGPEIQSASLQRIVSRTSFLENQSSLKMPPRPTILFRLRVAPSIVERPAYRFYSSSTEPLLRVTNLEAPSSGHIRVLELNRPSARNAISRALLQSLREQVDDVQGQYTTEGGEVAGTRSPTRALVISSAVDECFCAGADLKERRKFTREEYINFSHATSLGLLCCLTN